MNNNLFLKKYKKSCELVTKEGPLGILNHLHYNIIGFKPKAKKKKKPPPKKPEPDYSYVTSIVKYDFNQNKNFVPQLNNLLNYLKNKEMNNNIIKSRTQLKKNNNNEEKHYNFIKNDNNNDDDDEFNTKIIRKKLKFKTDNEKQNYINLDKLTEQNMLKFKNKRIQNQIVNKNQSMTSNNDINSYIFDKNSNKILPLINHSQDMNNYLKINKMNNNSKIKSFTPFINRQSRIYDKNKIRKFHFNKEIINNEILKKSNSTMNIYRKNNDDINIENNYIYNENNNDKINNLFSKEIAENKNNEEIKERNLNMIKQRINKFNELKLKNNQIEDNHKYLNIIEEEEDENSKNSNVNNNKNLNLLQILMKQRQQYFKNMENSIKYQKAMSMDF